MADNRDSVGQKLRRFGAVAAAAAALLAQTPAPAATIGLLDRLIQEAKVKAASPSLESTLGALPDALILKPGSGLDYQELGHRSHSSHSSHSSHRSHQSHASHYSGSGASPGPGRVVPAPVPAPAPPPPRIVVPPPRDPAPPRPRPIESVPAERPVQKQYPFIVHMVDGRRIPCDKIEEKTDTRLYLSRDGALVAAVKKEDVDRIEKVEDVPGKAK